MNANDIQECEDPTAPFWLKEIAYQLARLNESLIPVLVLGADKLNCESERQTLPLPFPGACCDVVSTNHPE